MSILILAETAFAKNEGQLFQSNYDNYFCTFNTFPSQSKDSLDIVITYKIKYSEMNFLNNNGILKAIPIIEFELKDNQGVVRKRVRKTDTIYESNNKDIYYISNISAKVLNANYSLKFSILVGSKTLFIKKDEISIQQLTKQSIFQKPILVNSTKKLLESDTINMEAYGDIFDIKSTNPSFIFFSKNTSVSPVFKIKTIKSNFQSIKSYAKEAIVKSEKQYFKTLRVLKENNSQAIFEKDSSNVLMCVSIPDSIFYLGDFQLIAIVNKDTISYNYSVSWVNKPLSLNKIDYIENIMKYIQNDEERKSFKNSENKEEYLIQYWKKFDPNPKTFFNEIMELYFRRADQAKLKFITLLYSDGALTARGKIYILYGNPNYIENEIVSQKSKEIWHYNNCKKDFIFEMTSPGDYNLIKIVDKD